MNVEKQYDVVGVGFGPSNLALSIAIEEYNRLSSNKIKALFLESKSDFNWYPDMMLPDSNMQIAFPKDLATFRNPKSEYTFFNYLFEKGRLPDFVNLKSFYPFRVEFADYLKWAAEKIQIPVQYSSKVITIKQSDNLIDLSYMNRANVQENIRAKNVVIGMGLSPKMPQSIQPGVRIFHNRSILDSIKRVKDFKHNKVAILGAGQSAAEVITYFYSEFPEMEIHTIFSRFGLTPSDSTPYNNQIFDPEIVNDWYATNQETRDLLFNYHKTTNYSAVDEDLINKIYGLQYKDSVINKKRIYMENASVLTECEEKQDSVHLKIKDLFTQNSQELDVDILVCATGFAPTSMKNILSQPEDYSFNGDSPQVTRNYQLELKNNEASSIYLNGCTESSHGFSSTLLSVTAVRAGEILNSIISK
ncbi:MAG: lysine N(6)-hydroxylase/L-ornithine N(5)-oxygenase family protein [Neisseriaceae bacterium]|nr:lysine N(6)-hydroxylase/L-ornithine N(5)-oxygenase family protein [Neisseriaceae bacterium]